MLEKAIITSCSNKFFPSVINLISSIKLVYPDHPKIFVYDLGLFSLFRKELERIDNVSVIKMPHFCGHWRSCYTWKTYIFAHPLARLNLYFDAGCQVLKPLEEDFSIIEKENLLLIDQGQSFKLIVPEDYKKIFGLKDDFDDLTTIHAGIIGFKDIPQNNEIFLNVFSAAYAGLALGFSRKEKWRNRGKDRNGFVRDCEIFRHDLTLVNIFIRKVFGNMCPIQPVSFYDGNRNSIPEQRVWQLRLSYSYLENTAINFLHKRNKGLYIFNRFMILLMICIKNINIFLKKRLFKII